MYKLHLPIKLQLLLQNWYINKYKPGKGNKIDFEGFMCLPFDLQWGVLVMFFESIGCKVSVEWLEEEYWAAIQEVYMDTDSTWLTSHEAVLDDITEARKNILYEMCIRYED